MHSKCLEACVHKWDFHTDIWMSQGTQAEETETYTSMEKY